MTFGVLNTNTETGSLTTENASVGGVEGRWETEAEKKNSQPD